MSLKHNLLFVMFFFLIAFEQVSMMRVKIRLLKLKEKRSVAKQIMLVKGEKSLQINAALAPFIVLLFKYHDFTLNYLNNYLVEH